MMLWTRVGFVDPFTYPPGEPLTDPREVYDSADVQGGRRYVSLDWLRRLAGRPKDLLDLEALEKMHGPAASPPTRDATEP